MLLSYYGKSLTPEDIVKSVPVIRSEHGEDWGTINQNLATWCLSLGYSVVMYSSDFQILDTSWKGMEKAGLLERLRAVKNHRNVVTLGKKFSEIYVQSYIDFINAGGELRVEQFITTPLLDSLLENGPVLACVCMNTYYGHGRQADGAALRTNVSDDTRGKLYNHSVVVHGKDDEGSYLIADPWATPGMYAVEPEKLVLAVQAAQIECDNLLFQVIPKA